MSKVKKTLTILPISLSLFFLASPAFAAAPDGLGPWADTVVSSHQGVMKNGLPVPAVRSDATAALGVAEGTPTVDATFFSLGFAGNIVLGFDNGISTGAMVVEATIEPGYPLETAKVEMSQDGVHWVMSGNVSQTGTVAKPAQIQCAKFVRITDTSDPAIMPDAIADGYDVDGVEATGTLCTPTSPTPTPTLPTRQRPGTPTPTPTPTQAVVPSSTQSPTQPPSNGGGGGGGSSSSSSNTSTTTSSSCTPSGIVTTPQITLAKRLSPTSIFVSWGPNVGLNNFIVQYGFQNGNWQFSTKVSGFSTTIDNLPSNQSIWIEVAATDNCTIGSFGGSVLVGGTPTTNSPGFPNTGGSPCIHNSNPLIPCFPNTGIDPNEKSTPSSTQTGIQYIFSLFLYFVSGTQ